MPSRAGALSPGILGPLVGDVAIGVAALYGAFLVRIGFAVPWASGLLPPERLALFDELWPWLVLSQPLALYLVGFYHPRADRPRLELARSVAFAVGAQTAVLGAALFFSGQAFPRSVLVLFAVLDTLGLTTFRAVLQRLARVPKRRVVILGAGPAAAEVARTIREHHAHGLYVHGHLPLAALPGWDGVGSGRPHPDEPSLEDEPALGERLPSLEAVEELLERGAIHDLILAPDAGGWRTALLDRLGGARRAHPTVLLLPGPFESLIGALRYRWINDLPLIEVTRESDARRVAPSKRAIDLAGALLLLAIAAPAMALAALAVRLTSRGPVFFLQERVGRDFRPFHVLKFRTMRVDAERDTGEVLAVADDPRLTSIGGFLRRYRVDELPQLVNVLFGEMSLVGPRPERPGFVARHLETVPGYAERFLVTPGLTGLAQVNGEYHSTPENKLRYDLAYIANRSLWLDVSILLRTVRTVLTSRGI